MSKAPPALAQEFETILRATMATDPDLKNWDFDGLDVVGVMAGAAEAEHNHQWTPDRSMMIALARHFIEQRAARWDDGALLVGPAGAAERQRLHGQGVNTSLEISDGWLDLVGAFVALTRDHGVDIEFSQIKEKFGLRIYHSGDTYSHDLEHCADLLSSHICERCGAPGRVRKDRGWWSTRCDLHAET